MTNPQTDLTVPAGQPQAAPLAIREEPSIGAMMKAVIDGGVTADAVNVMAKLIELRNAEDARNAKRAFAEAFADLQSECRPITPTRMVPNKDGSPRYYYAPYEEIMREVSPLLRMHGFSIQFDTQVEGPRVTVIATLMHKSGHDRSNRYSVRIGSGAPGTSEAQADGGAYTYAQRGALCDCLGITIAGRDNDAREIGAPVTQGQADDLRQRVEALGKKVNIAAFFKFAGATSFETIPSGRYADINSELQKKESEA